MDENNKLEFASRLDLGQLQSQLDQVRSQLKKVIVGQERMIDYLLVAPAKYCSLSILATNSEVMTHTGA